MEIVRAQLIVERLHADDRDEVDSMAVDGCNWDATHSGNWQTYADILAPTVREVGDLAISSRSSRS